MTRFAHRYYIQPMAFVIAVMVMIFSRLVTATRRTANQLGRVRQFTSLDSLMHYCSSHMLVVVVSEVCKHNLLPDFLSFWRLGIFFGVLNPLVSEIGVSLVVMPGVVIITGFDFWLLPILSNVFVFALAGFWVATPLAGALVPANLAIVIVAIGSGFVFMELVKRLNFLTFRTGFHTISQTKTPPTLARRHCLGDTESQRGSLKVYDCLPEKTNDRPVTVSPKQSNYTRFGQWGQLWEV